MLGRRRPIAGFFAALLLWGAAVDASRAPQQSDVSMLRATPEGAVAASVAARPPLAIGVRAPSRTAPNLQPSGDLPFEAAPASVIRARAVVRDAPVMLAQVRRASGLASTYDATAPPLGTPAP